MRAFRVLGVMSVLLVPIAGCGPPVWDSVWRSWTASARPQLVRVVVLGGAAHTTLLGCASCDRFDPESIFNPTGPYGSPDSAMSVANHAGEFGSPSSPYSACNPEATDPPLLADRSGRAYGRLTMNRRRVDAPTGGLATWLATVCAS